MPTYVDSTIAFNGGFGNGGSISRPSGTAEGHYMLLMVSANAGSAGNIGTPSGGVAWAQLATTQSSSSLHTKLFGKRAGGSEPPTYSWTVGSNARSVVICAAYADVDETEAVVAAGSASGSGSNVSTPGVTPGGAGWTEVRFAIGLASDPRTFTPPTGFTEREDGQDGAFTVATMIDRLLETADATSAINVVASGSLSQRCGYTVALPAVATPVSRRPIITSPTAVHRASRW